MFPLGSSWTGRAELATGPSDLYPLRVIQRPAFLTDKEKGPACLTTTAPGSCSDVELRRMLAVERLALTQRLVRPE